MFSYDGCGGGWEWPEWVVVRAQWLSRARLPHNFERGDGNHDVMAQEQKSHTEEGKVAEMRVGERWWWVVVWGVGSGVGGGGSNGGGISCGGVKEDRVTS